jgi:hypothetical protein
VLLFSIVLLSLKVSVWPMAYLCAAPPVLPLHITTSHLAFAASEAQLLYAVPSHLLCTISGYRPYH